VSTVDDVRRLLSSAPGDPLCAACLAFACATSLREMLAVTETLLEADRDFHRGVLALVAAVLCQRSSTAPCPPRARPRRAAS
jgi:hypothetical protein